MRAAFVALLLLVTPHLAFAADGVEAPPTIPANTTSSGAPTCLKLCDTKTTAVDCGPIYSPIQNANHVVIKVETAINGASACTFDEWGVYETRTNTTPAATNTFGALCAIDDDTTTAIVGATAGSECKIFGPVGPWVFIDAGTLGTCTNFTITGCWWPTPK